MNHLILEWLKKLRSGDYKKGTDHLKSYSQYKCLEYCTFGVLADVLVAHGYGYWGGVNKCTFFCELPLLSSEGSEEQLPTKLLMLLGLDNTVVADLVDANDNYDSSFSEIADKIEDWFSD